MKNFKLPAYRALKTIALILLSLTCTSQVEGQQQAPVIKATATTVDIRDGNVFQKGIWNLSPEVKLDTYAVLSPITQKKVIFYTDIDSVAFEVTPGHVYDFIVVLNGKDSCRTRISAIAPQMANNEAIALSTDPIPAEKLRSDFTLFRETLQKEHPGLYRYKRKAALDALFERSLALLNHPMDQFDFGKILMTTVSKIEDGHTSTDLPRLLVKYYIDRDKLFPIPLYFRSDKAYVICDQADGLKPGTEVLEINGHKIREIQRAMYVYLPADGAITTKKRHIINEGAFSVLYRLHYGSSDSFVVRYRAVRGKTDTKTIAAKFAKDFPCEPPPETSSPTDLQFRLLSNGIALLKIRSFEMNRVGGKISFRAFLDSTFRKIKSLHTRHLIIDIRDNGGGEDALGAWLYSYLTDKPFRYYASLERANGLVQGNAHPNLGVQRPNPLNFKGDCYFLINGRSFSSAAELCAVAKSNGRGKFIGEETGGGYYGNTSGEQLKLALSNTGITVIVPLIKYTLAVKQMAYKDRGVMPDYPLVPSIQQVLAHDDIQLNLAIKLAGSVKGGVLHR